MDDADQGMEASAATIRDRNRRQNAVTLDDQRAIYTKNLRPSDQRVSILYHQICGRATMSVRLG